MPKYYTSDIKMQFKAYINDIEITKQGETALYAWW